MTSRITPLEALSYIREYADCIPLHTEDLHALHYVEMIKRAADAAIDEASRMEDEEMADV